MAKRLNKSKYSKVLKKEPSKELSDKIIRAAVDLAVSKISDIFTSLKMSDKNNLTKK